jgi:hypothetical protein
MIKTKAYICSILLSGLKDLELEKKTTRMLRVCNLALDQIALRGNAVVLAPRAWDILKELGNSHEDVYYGTNYFRALRIDGYHSIKNVDRLFEHAKGK